MPGVFTGRGLDILLKQVQTAAVPVFLQSLDLAGDMVMDTAKLTDMDTKLVGGPVWGLWRIPRLRL